MEFLSILGIVIYIVYSIVEAVNKTTKAQTLSQPKGVSPKTISTKDGAKTLEEIIAKALEQKRLRENNEPSQAITIYEDTSKEVVNYEQKSTKLTKIKINKPILKPKEHKESKRTAVEKYENKNVQSDLRFDKDDLKRAFILSEILQKKY